MVPDLSIQTPMPFRGGWNDISANNASHARQSSMPNDMTQHQDNNRQDILSAGPKSGEAVSANRTALITT